MGFRPTCLGFRVRVFFGLLLLLAYPFSSIISWGSLIWKRSCLIACCDSFRCISLLLFSVLYKIRLEL
jgi:hypothetical protein